MAKLTLALASAQLAAKDAELAALREELSHLQSRIKHDYIEMVEYNRVQGVLRSTQQFLAKYKRQLPRSGMMEARPAASGTKRPFSERCKAYFAATGARSVTMPQLQAWEQANA